MKFSKTPILSFSWVFLFVTISCSCHNVFAFAFTKIPKSLIDDRHPHQDRRRNRYNRESIIGNGSGNKKNGSSRTSVGLLSAVDVDDDVVSAKQKPTGDVDVDGDVATINQSRLLLGLVAILYGTLNVSLRLVYDVPDIPPTAAALSATRGWLAFMCFFPPLLLDKMKTKAKANSIGGSINSSKNGVTTEQQSSSDTTDIGPLLRSAIELAVWGFLAQGLLNVGLLSTGSARASFLTQTSVLFTPLISTLIGKQFIGRNVWFGCVVALIGLVVLTMGTGAVGGAAAATASAFSLSLSRGDLFVMGGALSWSMYLFRISSLGPKHPELILQGVKTGLVAVLYSIWWIVTTVMNSPPGAAGGLVSSFSFTSLPPWMTSSYIVWIALFFSAIGPGTIADVLQQKAQKNVSASEANVLLSSEPVFATFFAVLLLGEKTSMLEIVGGGLILVAALIASSSSSSSSSSTSSNNDDEDGS